MSVVEQDTYIRPNQAGWGVASNGHTWANFGDTANLALSILSNQGKATGSSNDNWIIIGSIAYSNINILVRIAATSNAAGEWNGISARYTDTNNHYRCYIRGTSLEIEKKVAGVATIINNAGIINTANQAQWVRFLLAGATLKGKQWIDGTNEPNAWTVTTTDNTFNSGTIGLFVSPNTTADVTTFDNFSATTPTGILIGNHRTFAKIR